MKPWVITSSRKRKLGVIARKAMFSEIEFISHKESESPVDLEEIRETQPLAENDNKQSTVDPEIIVQMPKTTPIVRHSIRTRQEPDRFGFFIPKEEVFLMDQYDPINYEGATVDPKSEKWLKAMRNEIQSMNDSQVWDLIDLPLNSRVVGSKWVLNKKINMDGNVQTSKA